MASHLWCLSTLARFEYSKINKCKHKITSDPLYYVHLYTQHAWHSPVVQPHKNRSAPKTSSLRTHEKCARHSQTHACSTHASAAVARMSIPSASSKRIGNGATYISVDLRSDVVRAVCGRAFTCSCALVSLGVGTVLRTVQLLPLSTTYLYTRSGHK